MALKRKNNQPKVCLSAVGESLDSLINPRFGRCQYFLVGPAGGKDGDFQAISNVGVGYARGAGITAAQIIADQGVTAVITGNIGPNAFTALQAAGIEVYLGTIGKTVRENLEDYQSGKLEKSVAPGRGFGSGQGFGRGRGGGRR